MFHSEPGRAVPVENRFRCYRRVKEFFLLGGDMNLARWKFKVFLIVAVMFSLQWLASDLFVCRLFEVICARSALVLYS